MEESLVADLRASAGIAAIVASHNGRKLVDWTIRPDKAGLPAVTMHRVSTDKLYAQGGPVGLTGARVQFDCWATSYGVSRTLFRALQGAVETGGSGWRGFLATARDFAPENLDGGQRVFRSSGDFNIWYQE